MNLNLSSEAVEEGVQIILWPETALPVYAFGGSYPQITDRIFNFIEENQVGLLTGMPDIRIFSGKENIPDYASMVRKMIFILQLIIRLFFSFPVQEICNATVK